MSSLIFAAAQFEPAPGKVEANMEKHLAFAQRAALKGAQILIFPELSITGYEPELAQELAFSQDDVRLLPLIKAAQESAVTLVAGLPLLLHGKLHIAACICAPNGSLSFYTKHHLHDGEERFFEPGSLNPQLEINGKKVALAICADTAHSIHPRNAARDGADVYAAGIFFTPNGYDADAVLLQSYAQEHQMAVVIANFIGRSGGFDAAGRSAAWASSGQRVGELSPDREELLLVELE